MIIHTGLRTDIPAFYGEWLENRFREGFVLVRNPYNAAQVTRYRLSPDIVDLVCFCTKNPGPMLSRLDAFSAYRQHWFVTITPYGRDIEPNVPSGAQVIESFRELSGKTGAGNVHWRYDPILLTEKYTEEYHIAAFADMAHALRGYTDTCVISFVDLYAKVRRNFPECKEVPLPARERLAREFVRIAAENGMRLKSCAEGEHLAQFGVDTRGCMTMETFENSVGEALHPPGFSKGRGDCACFLGADIGAYDTCMHLCRYCYANANEKNVRRNTAAYDPKSPILCGKILPGDKITDAKQISWREDQLKMEF